MKLSANVLIEPLSAWDFCSFFPHVQFVMDHTTAADICSFADSSRALLQKPGQCERNV